jgi:hypothetical protein
VVCVDLGEVAPFVRKVVQSEDCGDGTDGHTGAAIDALHRIDIKQGCFREACFILSRVNAIDRARIHTCCILHSDARFGDYVCHDYNFLFLG